MLHFVLTRPHAYTVRHYLETWGRDLRRRVGTVCYEDLAFGPALDPGTYVFTDLERLSPTELELATTAWRQLATRPDAYRLLNDPGKVLRRFELLRALHAAGINRFTAHALSEGNAVRYPAFVRRASDHDGALSPIVNSRAELDAAVADLVAGGAPREDLIVTEYCDTRDAAGVFRKYSAFRAGDRIIARHLFHSDKWMLKKADLLGPERVDEELAYLRDNPHEEQLRKVFDLARVDYGRVDYALLDGQVQVWEINTNPTILVVPGRVAPDRLLAQGLFAQAFADALTSIDFEPPASAPPHRLDVPASLSRRLGVTFRARFAYRLARAANWLYHRPAIQRHV
jgi:hypothetical protein